MVRKGMSRLGLTFGLLLLLSPPAFGQKIPAEKALTLDDIIEVALARSPRLRVAERLAEEVERGADVARGRLFPQVEVFSSYLYSGPTSRNATRLGAAPPAMRMPLLSPRVAPDDQFSQHNFAEGITLTYPLFVGGRLVANVEASRLAALLAQDRIAQTRDELIFNLSSTYYTILRLREDIKATEASVKALEEAKRVIEAFVEAKKAPKVDLFKVNTRLAAVRQDLIRVRNQLDVAYGVLNTLMGLEDVTQRFMIAGKLEYTPQAFELKKGIEEAGERRPELKIRRREVEIQAQKVRMARAEQLPNVNLQISYMGLENNRGPFFHFDDLVAGVTVSVPIFTGGVITSRIAEEVARLERVRSEFERARLDVALEVQTAFLNILESEKRIETTKVALEEAREALRIEQLKTELGKGIIEDLLDAQAAELKSEANYFQALADYQISVVALQKAIGDIPTTR